MNRDTINRNEMVRAGKLCRAWVYHIELVERGWSFESCEDLVEESKSKRHFCLVAPKVTLLIFRTNIKYQFCQPASDTLVTQYIGVCMTMRDYDKICTCACMYIILLPTA